MKIVGRKQEINRLEAYYHSGRPEFIALYGRRRVGKTFLVEQLYGKKFAFNVTGVIEGTRKDEAAVFMNALRHAGYAGKAFGSWYEAFEILKTVLQAKIRRGKRCLIFIDELPCFDTHRSNFIKAFGNFWNDWCLKHSEVMLIVCGSATTWMIKNIINSHGGLHNRITHELHIRPFTLREAEQYIQYLGVEWDRLSIAQLYCALGGIPYYISLVDKTDSVAGAIDRLFFSKDAELKKEYDRLFRSLYKRPEPYIKIVEALCKNKAGMTRSQLSEAISCHGNGHLSTYLDNLEKCDFIRLYYIKDSKGRKLKSQGGIYQIMDLFTIFYNTFMATPTTDHRFWSNHLGSARLNTWNGLAFEKLCMCHISQIQKALGINQIASEYFSWRSKESSPQAQIDLVLERADRITNICEMKFSEQEYTLKKDEELKIRNRVGAYRNETKCKNAIQVILVTTYGLTQGKYSSLFSKVIDLDDLFK